MGRKLMRPPREVLEELYINRCLSINKMAAELGFSPAGVGRWMAHYKIKIRPAVQPVPDFAPSPEELRKLVWDNRITYREIGSRFGVGHMTVASWMAKYEIPSPPRGTSLMRKNKPTAKELASMYGGERRSAQSIADQFGVRKITALRWLKEADIDRRPACGLANRGVDRPTRETLDQMIHRQHLSYEEIGQRYGGVSGTAVAAWVRNFGLERPSVWVTRRNGNVPVFPTQEVLRERYMRGESTTAIGKAYGVSASTIADLMDSWNIKRRPPGWQQMSWSCTDGHQVRSSYEQRVDNWLFQHDLPHENDPPLPFGTNHRADFLVNGTYIEVWGVEKNETYNERKAWKKARFAEHGLALIELNSWMFSRETWKNKLTRGLIEEAAALAPARLW